MPTSYSRDKPSTDVAHLIEGLSEIRREMAVLEEAFSQEIQSLHSTHQESARNLIHYVSLRRHDLRPLQAQLASHGLSSLGRSESQVGANLDAVLKALHCLAGEPSQIVDWNRSQFASGRSLLHKNTAALLGPKPEGRTVRIMVTMPLEAALDYALVRDCCRAA